MPELHDSYSQKHSKGAYIKYVGGGGGRRVLQIFQTNFVAQETIELNIS